MKNNLQKSDLLLLRMSAAKLVTAIFKLVYVVRYYGLIRLFLKKLAWSVLLLQRMHARVIAFQKYILELLLVFISVIAVQNNLTG